MGTVGLQLLVKGHKRLVSVKRISTMKLIACVFPSSLAAAFCRHEFPLYHLFGEGTDKTASSYILNELFNDFLNTCDIGLKSALRLSSPEPGTGLVLDLPGTGLLVGRG